MKRLVLTIHGRVQGVFFRVSACAEALRLGLTGFAANQPDGTVRIVAEGPEASLKDFAAGCYTGSRFAEVEKVDILWENATGEFSTFEIR